MEEKNQMLKLKDNQKVKKSQKGVFIGLGIGVVLLLLIVIYSLVPNKKLESSSPSNTNSPPSIATISSVNQSFKFRTIKGQQFKVEATKNHFKVERMENKIMFLKIFGWNCQYCEKEIPELINLKKQLDGSFDVIALEYQGHTKEQCRAFVEQYGINYHIVMGENHKNFYNYLKEHYGWSGIIPLSIILGEDGKVLAFEIGYKSYTLAELLQTSIKLKGKLHD